MSRISPIPVDIRVGDEWVPGTLRVCEVTPDGDACSAVVSYGGPVAFTTARVDETQVRAVSGEPGCPPEARQDATCCT
jgi:hypothetical protein